MGWTDADLDRLQRGHRQDCICVYCEPQRSLKQEPIAEQPKARGRIREPKGMNRTETAYSAHLAMLQRIGEVAWFRFEPFNIRIGDNCFWLVDFAVMLADGQIHFVDTKGTKKMKRTSGEVYGKPYITEDATVKLRAAAEMYPFVVKAVYFYGNEWKEKVF